jgi:GH25 family lysozyme M1 (1,4-beta-N-acetylmuramidase)
MLKWCCFVACFAGCGGEFPVDQLEEANTQQCPMQTVEGIDVFAGQGTVDWAKVNAAGRKFAFIKATQGDYNKQSTFAANWQSTQANGLLRSPYHFFDPTVDGVAQAQWFLAEVAAAGGLQAGDLPPMLDIECPTSSNQANAQPNCEHGGDSGWAAPATLAQRVFDWLDAVEQATGRKAIIYSYPSWFAGAGFSDARLANYPLFIATYGSCASVPAPWTSAVFWQYSGSGSVTGVSGNVDEDRFFGDEAGLMRFVAGSADDAGVADAAARDAATDAAAHDAATLDGAGGDAGAPAPARGCQCRLGGGALGAPELVSALALIGWIAKRRRKRVLGAGLLP